METNTTPENKIKLVSSRLTSNHKDIFSSIDHIKENIYNYPHVKELLRDFEGKINEHLIYQSEEFYSQLYDCYTEDGARAKAFDVLKANLIECKVASLTFYEKHPCDMSDVSPKNLVLDFIKFSNEVIDRIKLEKEILK